jgi:hypothetical protein
MACRMPPFSLCRHPSACAEGRGAGLSCHEKNLANDVRRIDGHFFASHKRRIDQQEDWSHLQSISLRSKYRHFCGGMLILPCRSRVCCNTFQLAPRDRSGLGKQRFIALPLRRALRSPACMAEPANRFRRSPGADIPGLAGESWRIALNGSQEW